MTTDQWAAVVGFVLPALVAIINREPWKPWIKAVVALVSSALVGTVTALLSGQFTGATWIQAIGIVFAASQVAYMLWWKKSGITDWIEQNILPGLAQTPVAARHAAGALPPAPAQEDGIPGGSARYWSGEGMNG